MSNIKKSYTKNYLQTYLWRGIAILLNMASMFIVVPMITDNKVVYGVYSVCISTAMFLSYADLGFVSAGFKYAGEAFARGEKEEEQKLFGFSGFVLFVFVSLIAGVYFLFSYNPSLLIKGINESKYLGIASQLLFIQAIFSFNTILQRYVIGVFQIRIEQFIYQRVNIVGSLIKIVSVFYFFSSGKYDIVSYFLFIKIVELLTLSVGIAIIQRKYNLFFIDYLRAFKFDKKVYEKIKGLAFSSLFVTLMWIMYFELDLIVIGKFIGPEAVAVYALAYTFVKFLRSLSSTIFGPFQSRYNHYVGLGNIDGLRSFVNKVITYTLPVFVFVVISIVFLSKNIIFTWAGQNFTQSSIILIFLVLHFMYSFITKPSTSLLVSLERIKEMYLVNFVMVFIYWFGIIITTQYLGVISFAVFKFVSGTIAMLFYLWFIINFLKTTFFKFMRSSVFQLIIPVLLQIGFLLLVRDYLPIEKGKISLLLVITMGGISTIIGFITLVLLSKIYSLPIKKYYKTVINK